MKHLSLALLLLSTFFITQPLYGATSTQEQEKSQARKDFVRLSDDGDIAFSYISSARNAIFEGDLVGAKTFLDEIKTALNRAQKDHQAFTDAEKALGEPTTPQTDSNKKTPQATWLPIHGDIKLHDNHHSAQNEALIIAANHYLHTGDLGQAAELLHQRKIQADYVISAIPLQKAQKGIDNAITDLNTTPFKSNKELKAIQDSVSYETVPLTSNENISARNNTPSNKRVTSAPQ